MQTYQTWIGVGHTTHDVELHHAATGTIVGRFSVACNHERYSRDNEPEREVLFMRCTAFGKTAEFLARYAFKGSLVAVQGRLKMESWTDRDTGADRSMICCIVESAKLLKGARGPENPPANDNPGPPRDISADTETELAPVSQQTAPPPPETVAQRRQRGSGNDYMETQRGKRRRKPAQDAPNAPQGDWAS